MGRSEALERMMGTLRTCIRLVPILSKEKYGIRRTSSRSHGWDGMFMPIPRQIAVAKTEELPSEKIDVVA